MKAYTTAVAAKSGTGTQTVSGIVDASGAAFTPKLAIIWGNSVANTLETFARSSFGLDDGTTHYGTASDEATADNLKLTCTCAGNVSIFDEQAELSFGGLIEREAYCSAFASGTATMTYTLNNRTGDSFLVTFLGGDDLSALVGLASGSTTTTFAPVAAFFHPLATHSDPTTSGGYGLSYGWATSDGKMGASGLQLPDGAGANSRYQRTTDCVFTWANPTTISDERSVTAWGSSGFTFSGAATSAYGYAAVGGCQATCGALTQPLSTGIQEIVVGLNPKAFFLLSYGTTAGTSVDTTLASMSYGTTDGTRQGSYWTGEDVTSDTAALDGARFLSTSDLFRVYTPAGGSSTLLAAAQLAFFNPDNLSVLLNWSTVDSTPRQVLWLALGDLPSPAPTPVVFATRRERIFSLPFDMNLEVFLQRLEILVQSGVGLSTGQGADPVLMLSISRDGGHSFGNEIQLGVGKIGEYQRRAYANRLGRGRNLVCKIACSDPVFFALLACYVDAAVGTS